VKTFFEIELVGDNTRQLCNLYRNVTNDIVSGLGDSVFGSFPPSGWVAEITGFDPKYKYARSFLKFKKDYSRANSKGSRGVFAEYILQSGRIYDIKDNRGRYFCKVNETGDIIKISESEVTEWLKNHSELTSLQPPENE